MSNNKEFDVWAYCASFVLATEELGKHTNKTPTEWREQFIRQALHPYMQRDEKVMKRYVDALVSQTEEWAVVFVDERERASKPKQVGFIRYLNQHSAIAGSTHDS
ncbi:hypothetical protein [Myxacorys almedinensis]|uniref:Uncharacterized protein n=1 Tax=Myxacorys almedinensis A TaxID=2690445 RepID=A0A8J7YZ93_9CYAN|nr:hypothetical protein [Myxacorys almedinensis]NDJ16779.1 hypothetical protein [Myxacorys almedinensis A]